MKLRCEFNGITTLKRNGFGYDWLKRFHDKPFKSKIKDFVFQLTASEHYYCYLSNLNLNVKICSGVGKKNVND